MFVVVNSASPGPDASRRSHRLGGTQLYAVHLFFQAVEGGIADFATVAQGKQCAPGGIHCAQTQTVCRAIWIGHSGLAVRLDERNLKFDAQGLGKPRWLAVERSQRRAVGDKAGTRHLLGHRIVVAQI
jgi:hypothetical protein